MGYRVGGECYAQLATVADQMCASMAGVSGAGVVRCVGVSPVAFGYSLQIETTSGSGQVTASSVGVPQIPCDEGERARDLAELFGLGLVAVLGVFLVREFIYRLVMPQ